MQVLHLSVECYPVAKVGGLADVVGSLPKYQCQLGVDAAVVMPWYDKPFVHQHTFDIVAEDSFYQGSEQLHYQVLKEKDDTLGFPLYLIYIPGKLDRPEVYCYADEAEQWIAFQHAFLHWIKYHGDRPDMIHCHDHHVGLLPFLTRFSNEFQDLSEIKTVFTVHNGQYQGWMSWNKSILMPPFDTWKWGLLDWDGVINPLATAIKCADAYTTVSEGYLRELYVDANGLQALFRDQSHKAHGIVNGIDTQYWNPSLDSFIPTHYNQKTVNKGKAVNKEAFCSKYHLPSDLPLISYIGRFALEKGADLLPQIIQKVFAQFPKQVSLFVLGSGDQQLESQITQLQQQFADNMGVFIGYNEALAHEVYAASDILLMPSRVEPCGLNQLYAMKYGTIPVVRGIGGLKDTVIDVDLDNGYGFVFEDPHADEAVLTLSRAITMFHAKRKWSIIRSRAMSLDFSWDKSAQKYIELYNQLSQ